MLSPFYGADLVSIVRKTRKGPQQDVGSNPTGSTIFYGPQHVQNCSHSNPRPHRIKPHLIAGLDLVWERHLSSPALAVTAIAKAHICRYGPDSQSGVGNHYLDFFFCGKCTHAPV